jgi:hypothetical protein
MISSSFCVDDLITSSFLQVKDGCCISHRVCHIDQCSGQCLLVM